MDLSLQHRRRRRWRTVRGKIDFEMWLPSLLFTLFAVLSAVGVYLILAHHKGRTAGIAGAFVTILLYVALYAGVLYLIRPLDSLQ
jgi:hypothetical protein